MNSSLRLAVPAMTLRAPVERFRGQSRSRLLRADLLAVLAWVSVAFAVALGLADGGAAGQLRPGHRRRRRVYLRPRRLGAQRDRCSPRARFPRRTTPLRKVRLVRTRAAVSAALAPAGNLLPGWQSGAHVADTGSATAATATGTFAGGAVPTRFGTIQVQTLSGATVTSDAYLTSLQAALDAANI